jgi:hypothetical protein
VLSLLLPPYNSMFEFVWSVDPHRFLVNSIGGFIENSKHVAAASDELQVDNTIHKSKKERKEEVSSPSFLRKVE